MLVSLQNNHCSSFFVESNQVHLHNSNINYKTIILIIDDQIIYCYKPSMVIQYESNKQNNKSSRL